MALSSCVLAVFVLLFFCKEKTAYELRISDWSSVVCSSDLGVFLLVRFWPVLAGTEQWFWIVGGAGMVTLVLGAFAAMFQQDLKAVLAYSTISHLGLITMLVGLGSTLGVVAAIFHIVNHATFKASLFMHAGPGAH